MGLPTPQLPNYCRILLVRFKGKSFSGSEKYGVTTLSFGSVPTGRAFELENTLYPFKVPFFVDHCYFVLCGRA
jgi:hypothetical protein